MKLFLFVTTLSICRMSYCQEFNISKIPDSILRSANVVKRMEELTVTIKADDKIIVRRKYALTILNREGDEYAEYINNYSNLEELSRIDGYLFDSQGNKIKSIKRKDIADESITDGFSLMLDDRIKKHNFYCRQYPYTILYEDEQELKSAYFLPYWFPVKNDGFSVQQSRFTVETPLDFNLRFKQINLYNPPVIIKDKTIKYTWEVNNLVATNAESLQPAIKDLLPIVYIGPKEFYLGKYKASMDSWTNLGKLNNLLNFGKQELPDKVKNEVHSLTDSLNSNSEKSIALYKYLQANTRYISVQLGLGGWQPFDAKYVATNKYGDCKALSNYMISLLNEVGIKANYVLVTAGSGKKGLSEDFPAPYFNHVITCVPNNNDTIWLECTSKSESPGYLGTFTGDRKALLINQDGGHVISTPSYQEDDNLQLRKITCSVDVSGELTAKLVTHFTGTQQENVHSLIHNANKEERERYLNNTISLPTYKVNFMEYKEKQGKIPSVIEELHITAPNFAAVSGKRLFIDIHAFNRSNTRLSKNINRSRPIQFTLPFKDIDTVQITIPTGYQPEAIPKDIVLTTSFSFYSVTYSVNDNQILVVRKQIRKRIQLPSTAYNEVLNYFEAMYKSDHSKIVFVKKENQ